MKGKEKLTLRDVTNFALNGKCLSYKTCKFIFLFTMNNLGKIREIEHFPFLMWKMPQAALFPLRHREKIQILHTYAPTNETLDKTRKYMKIHFLFHQGPRSSIG